MINMDSDAAKLVSDLISQLFEVENHSSALKKKIFELDDFVRNSWPSSRAKSELHEAKTKFFQINLN